MDYNKQALQLHKSNCGKLGTVSLVDVSDADELSTAYTPGVAAVCREIVTNPDSVYDYTMKSRTVAVVSNGTAVLGLGNIGPAAGLPVMEGKCILFKTFAGVDAVPLVIKADSVAEVVDFCRMIAPGFGGINLEDIKSPECFEIENLLRKELDIPVFHDDQHGTAIVVLSALINALRVVNKKIDEIKLVLNGPGAAGNAIIRMLMTAGVKNIIAVDEKGILSKDTEELQTEHHKKLLCRETNPENINGGLAEAVKNADVFIGVSKKGCLTAEMVSTMNADSVIFAMANPEPEIYPEDAKAGGARIVATGRSDYPNQVNNVLGFPGIFKGALSVRARDITDEMKLAAAYAIADLVSEEERSEDFIIPSALDKRVADAVANAVAEAAVKSGVARI